MLHRPVGVEQRVDVDAGRSEVDRVQPGQAPHPAGNHDRPVGPALQRPQRHDERQRRTPRAAAQLAKQQSGTVGDSQTVTVGGQRTRRYDIDYERDGKQLVERLAFVLRGKTEYLLLCRYERGGDTAACDRLLDTFTLG